MLSINYYINYSYSKTINTFYSYFNKCEFEDAKNIYNTETFITKLKQKTFKNDLSNYFTSIVSDLCDDIKNNKLQPSNVIPVFKEINTYNLLGASLDKLILSLDNNYTLENSSTVESLLNLAINKYNKGLYSDAIDMFNKVTESDTEHYDTAQRYIERCITSYKDSLFEKADNLVLDDYYTKAIELLSSADKSIVSSSDEDIENKISDIETSRENYLASISSSNESTTSSSSIIDVLNFDNLNTLSITSNTAYLIYVNLDAQRTYVYEGSSDNWTLIKAVDCSTGIIGEETPTGVYSITDRGEWFFSDEFDQGGKYWVQFFGDYLFHSVPFDESQENIVDSTLGVPASHGCIRLEVDDAQWLYDNITDDTKVIIN